MNAELASAASVSLPGRTSLIVAIRYSSGFSAAKRT